MHAYKTLLTGAEYTFVEKKSRFIGVSASVKTEDEALAFLNLVRKSHPGASHCVYAYLMQENLRARYSDDGEPQKTAGLPILEVLKNWPLTDAMIVVARYFGGTLLGTGGLVRAYTQAAQGALAASEVGEMRMCVQVKLLLPYSLRDAAVLAAEAAGARDLRIEYGKEVSLCFNMEAGTEQALLQTLSELTRGDNIFVSPPFYTLFKTK